MLTCDQCVISKRLIFFGLAPFSSLKLRFEMEITDFFTFFSSYFTEIIFIFSVDSIILLSGSCSHLILLLNCGWKCEEAQHTYVNFYKISIFEYMMKTLVLVLCSIRSFLRSHCEQIIGLIPMWMMSQLYR